MTAVPAHRSGERRPQRGVSLLEALLASALLALGLHGALRLGVQGLQLGQETAEQLQARQLALEMLECHALPWPDCSTEQEVLWQGTRYRISLTRPPGTVPGVERLQARVQWQGVLPATGAKAGANAGANAGPDGDPASQQVLLWREVAPVPRWVGVSSP